MDPFPFSSSEWSRIAGLTNVLVVTLHASDTSLHERLLRKLECALDKLRVKYGEHPVLLQTEADYCKDPKDRVAKYRLAIRLAEQHRQPTLAIRISLARVLLEDLDDIHAAKHELIACKRELQSNTSGWLVGPWNDLHERCIKETHTGEECDTFKTGTSLPWNRSRSQR